MKLKVCGLKDPENILQVLASQPDYLGFIFYKSSPRFIADLDPRFVRDINSVGKVGVFVNDTKETILEKVKTFGLDLIQLHGDETQEFCSAIREYVPVIKAFQVDDTFDLSALEKYDDACDFFLFDSKSKNYGGSGKRFDHAKLEEYKLSKPVFLSGGLNLNITEEIIYLQAQFPFVHALDVNSRFETGPGIKDGNKIRVLIEKLRKHEVRN